MYIAKSLQQAKWLSSIEIKKRTVDVRNENSVILCVRAILHRHWTESTKSKLKWIKASIAVITLQNYWFISFFFSVYMASQYFLMPSRWPIPAIWLYLVNLCMWGREGERLTNNGDHNVTSALRFHRINQIEVALVRDRLERCKALKHFHCFLNCGVCVCVCGLENIS